MKMTDGVRVWTIKSKDASKYKSIGWWPVEAADPEQNTVHSEPVELKPVKPKEK